ncbi:hypothetical protein HBA94_05600 [Ochrobactrum sp. GRS2]|nr:hypothetical protein [Ochrobactrum sp. GRS2]
MENTIILSTEQHFNLRQEDQYCDLWIVDSPENLSVADRLRADISVRSVTTFRDRGDAATNIIMMLPTVLEHHPDCIKIIVRGLVSEVHDKVIKGKPELSQIASQQDMLVLKLTNNTPDI